MPSGFPPTGERGKPATEEAGSCWDLLAAGNHGQRGGMLGPTHRDAGAREPLGKGASAVLAARACACGQRTVIEVRRSRVAAMASVGEKGMRAGGVQAATGRAGRAKQCSVVSRTYL